MPDERQDARPTYDAAEGQRIKAAAYAEMVDELQNAWRKPVAAPLSIEPRATTDARSVPRTMTADAAQRIKDEAWLQSVKDLEIGVEGPRAMSKPTLEQRIAAALRRPPSSRTDLAALIDEVEAAAAGRRRKRHQGPRAGA